ncbi:hypothetical protein BTVI_101954 [Pitangus sulphuratus]|nr:hypothetical protein BTVI_101954 [Pitangus sulphuratus]
MPAGARIDPPLAKAESNSDAGSTSGITYLTEVKKTCATAAEERRETTVPTPKSVRKEVEKVLQAQNRDCPGACGANYGETAVPLPWRPMVEQIATYSLWRSPYWSRGRAQRRL